MACLVCGAKDAIPYLAANGAMVVRLCDADYGAYRSVCVPIETRTPECYDCGLIGKCCHTKKETQP